MQYMIRAHTDKQCITRSVHSDQPFIEIVISSVCITEDTHTDD
jgi:hypothetical protein